MADGAVKVLINPQVDSIVGESYMIAKEYEYDTKYIIKECFLNLTERKVRNLETRKDNEKMDMKVKWLSVKQLDSDTFGWVMTEWIECEMTGQDT